MIFGENLKRLRKDKGMTQETLAELVGTKKQTIQRYECGVIQCPPYDRIEALAMALATTPANLMGWEEDAPLAAPVTEQGGVLEEPSAVCKEEKESVIVAPDDTMLYARIGVGDRVLFREDGIVKHGGLGVVELDGERMIRRVWFDRQHDAVLLTAEGAQLWEPLILNGEERERLHILGAVASVIISFL